MKSLPKKQTPRLLPPSLNFPRKQLYRVTHRWATKHTRPRKDVPQCVLITQDTDDLDISFQSCGTQFTELRVTLLRFYAPYFMFVPLIISSLPMALTKPTAMLDSILFFTNVDQSCGHVKVNCDLFWFGLTLLPHWGSINATKVNYICYH